MYDSFTANTGYNDEPTNKYGVPPHGYMNAPNDRNTFGNPVAPKHRENNDEWKELLTDLPKIDVGTLREELEGPKPLRAIATLCGLAMSIAAAFHLINLPRALTHPAEFAIEVNMLIFGLSVILIESKTLTQSDQKRKTWLHQWFPFLTIIGGKGLAYMFFGSLGLSFGLHEMLNFVTGAAMTLMGVIYCLIQFAHNDTLAQKYDHSVYLSQFPR